MVRVEKSYTFDGPNGPLTLLDLFEGRRQLIIYHFMFDPAWDAGCPGCTGFFNSLGDLSLLAARDTTMAVISRAPLEKLERYRASRDWRLPWVSSFHCDFNYDFHASQDESIAPVEHNYRSQAELERSGQARVYARRKSRSQRVLPHRRRNLPLLFELCARYRRDHRCVQPARHDTVRPSAGLRGFTGRLATAADLRLIRRAQVPICLNRRSRIR